MDSFRVLLLDDALHVISAAAGWLYQGSDRLPAPPIVIPASSVAEAAAAVERGSRSGAPIDVAIVDLGLGPGKPSGLGAIDLFEKAGIPVAVHTDYDDGINRLMFVYAAFSWYRPVALLPKPRYNSGMDLDRVARDFASDIARIHDGQAPVPDLAAHFRPRLNCERPFERVLSSRADFLKWRAFVTLAKSVGVAASLGLERHTIENWVKEQYGFVWELLNDASNVMDITYAEIADPDPPEERRDDNSPRPKHDRQGAIHQFAQSQSWFFNDPVVRARYSTRLT
jgi:hypothetical protein